MEMELDESGFRAEYAKSDRSTCKGCRSTINKDALRLAVMVQSPNFDGKVSNFDIFDLEILIDFDLDSQLVSYDLFFQESQTS
jgi:hypothetical protein